MKIKGVAATLAAASMLFTAPAMANDTSGAEKLRRLDIMLMVTGLRCRSTADNFNSEYGRFTTRHMSELNRANAQLRAEMSSRHGAAGANRALDRLSTTMANTYGQGHPWLTCAELKQVAADLANIQGTTTLEEAADQLLSNREGGQWALRRR